MEIYFTDPSLIGSIPMQLAIVCILVINTAHYKIFRHIVTPQIVLSHLPLQSPLSFPSFLLFSAVRKGQPFLPHTPSLLAPGSLSAVA